MELTTKEFAAKIPCAQQTIVNWRNQEIFLPDHENERGQYVYTEEQLPAARKLLKSRKSTLRKATPDTKDSAPISTQSNQSAPDSIQNFLVQTIDAAKQAGYEKAMAEALGLTTEEYRRQREKERADLAFRERRLKILPLASQLESKIADIEQRLADPAFIEDAHDQSMQEHKRELESERDSLKAELAQLKADNPDVFNDTQDEDTADNLETGQALTPIIATDLPQLNSSIVDEGEKNAPAAEKILPATDAEIKPAIPNTQTPDISPSTSLTDAVKNEPSLPALDTAETLDGKKNKLANSDASQTTVQNIHGNNSTRRGFKQAFDNLPDEILSLSRWIEVGQRKDPKAPKETNWQRADTHRHYNELKGKIGFVCSVHQDDREKYPEREDYLLIDCDHVLDEQGEFVNDKAAIWCKFVIDKLADGEPVFCERSLSGQGLHILARPTPGKFNLAAKDKGTLYFGKHDTTEEQNACPKMELFVGTEGRQVILTGDLYHCTKNAKIPSGDRVDTILETLVNQISIENKPKAETVKPAPKPSKIFSGRGISQETIDAINQISATQMENAGLVTKATAGHYICPICGSGTHENATGAFAVDTNRGFTHWHCYSGGCSFDGNNIQLLAALWHLDQSADFVEILTRACDLFNFSVEYTAPTNGTQDKIKSCPVNLRLPDNYIFGNDGIYLVIPSKNDAPPKKICAARTPIIPTKKFIEPVKRTLEYEFAILSDGEWTKTEIDGGALADLRELAKTLAKHGALIDEPKILARFINSVISLNPSLPKLKSFNQPGWTTDECEEFAYPSTDGKTVIRRIGYDYERIFKPKGNPDAWKEKFCEITAQGGAQARVIIGAACAAPLIKPLEDLPNLQVHLWGKKSIGKTPMLKFAVSIFGDTDPDKLTHTFSSTPKSRLETACAFSDLPLICEELESAGAKDPDRLSTDIYNYFLGIGGQALKKDGTKREPKVFNGTRLTDGEHDLVQSYGNGGEFKRVLSLRCSKLLDEDFASDLYGFCKRNRGLFGKQWIEYIITNRDLISKTYHKTLDVVKAMQKNSDDGNDLTQLRTLVISAVAYQYFKICIGLSNSASDAATINAELCNDITTIIQTLPTADEIEDTARAIEFLKSFVAGNDKFFAHEVDKPDFDNEFSQSTPTCYGKIFKNGEVAFLPHALDEILRDKGGFKSPDKLRAEFCDKGYLRNTRGKYTCQTWFNGHNVKMIRFKADIISTAEETSLDTIVADYPSPALSL